MNDSKDNISAASFFDIFHNNTRIVSLVPFECQDVNNYNRSFGIWI